MVEAAAVRLKSIREGLDLSQRFVAELAGVDPSLVNRLERGCNARLSTWQAVFEAMGCIIRFDVDSPDDDTAHDLRDMMEERRENRRLGRGPGRRPSDPDPRLRGL